MADSAKVREWKQSERDDELVHIDDWLCRPVDGFQRDARSSLRPLRIPHIERAIGEARRLYELPDNWDDDGAVRISRVTWDLAVDILRGAARTALRRYDYSLPAPTIGPCADGSIDLFWRAPDFTLLINVKSDEGDSAGYYAEGGGAKAEGFFNPREPKFDFLLPLVRG